jgi:hypothetical protein
VRRRRKVMRLEQKYVDIAIEQTEKVAKEKSVIFNGKDIEEFKRTLKGIAEASKYTEGQEMSQNDLAAVASGMNKVFDGVARNFAQLDENFKSKTNLSHYSVIAYRHLLSLAMKELNCPNVPPYAFYGSVSELARKVSREKPTKNLTVEDTHKDQRRTDAKDVLERRSVGTYIKNIKYGFRNPDEVANLYAEYRALSIRQDNHTAIWRFFHREENEARTNLLNEMESALKMVIPEEVLAEKPSAKEIIQYGDWLKTKTFIPQFLSHNAEFTESEFGYYDYKNNSELYDAWKLEFDKKQEKPLNEQLANDLEVKDEKKTEKIPNEPTIASPSKSING